jgi:hypothetical protein
MRTFKILSLAAVLVAVPLIADAAVAKTFCELVKFFVDIFNAIAALCVTAAITIYVFSISSNIKSAGEAKSNMKRIIGWGMIGLFIMVSIWGILRILQETLTQATPVGTSQGRTC